MALRFLWARYSPRRIFFDLLVLAGTAILGGCGEMLLHAFREIMRTGSVRPQHEVKVIRVGWMQGRRERFLAGVADRSWREARITVSFLRVRVSQVGLVHCCPDADGKR